MTTSLTRSFPYYTPLEGTLVEVKPGWADTKVLTIILDTGKTERFGTHPRLATETDLANLVGRLVVFAVDEHNTCYSCKEVIRFA